MEPFTIIIWPSLSQTELRLEGREPMLLTALDDGSLKGRRELDKIR